MIHVTHATQAAPFFPPPVAESTTYDNPIAQHIKPVTQLPSYSSIHPQGRKDRGQPFFQPLVAEATTRENHESSAAYAMKSDRHGSLQPADLTPLAPPSDGGFESIQTSNSEPSLCGTASGLARFERMLTRRVL